MKFICVFCGSNFGTKPAYVTTAKRTGQALVERGLGLVYGGGKVGLMGALADAVLEQGGQVIGVMPRALVEKEIAHHGLTELHVVGSMHERKALMADLADGFIALPGGFGTFEEFCEILTWAQLGYHRKPCGLLNVENFYDPLLNLFNHSANEGFIRAEHRSMVLVERNPARLLRLFENYEPPALPKWVERDET
ncbi:MAG TPA: TIGR00730 family Rossman fold protein [Anaerolineae bacterium]|nr:TIGR00730 family Rossman fold protein [Anaerolineae bacterium]HMR62470.1 TIGR00730 family Rossman fold protein [Anaerolineae bacterium]